MRKLRKNRKKVGYGTLTFAAFSLVLSGFGCNQGAPQGGLKIDHGDAKMAAQRIAEADALYQGREDLQKARLAVASLRQARTADYGSYEAAWKLARASFYVGDRTPNDDERDDLFREGTEAGKVAIQLEPDKPEGHFWLGANYGGAAQHSTIANLSSFQDIKGEMEAVLRIDESYQGYSAYLGLGRLYLQAPLVFGGDTGKAIDYLEKGVKSNPSHALMRFHLAEAYESRNREAEAMKQIEAVLALPPDPDYAAEHKEAVEKAKKLQQRIDNDRR